MRPRYPINFCQSLRYDWNLRQWSTSGEILSLRYEITSIRSRSRERPHLTCDKDVMIFSGLDDEVVGEGNWAHTPTYPKKSGACWKSIYSHFFHFSLLILSFFLFHFLHFIIFGTRFSLAFFFRNFKKTRMAIIWNLRNTLDGVRLIIRSTSPTGSRFTDHDKNDFGPPCPSGVS